LGGGAGVDPQSVYDDIELLGEMSEYGLRGDLRAQQGWSDELLFTREQLEKQPVKDAICSWAVYFGADIKELSEGRQVPYSDQFHWSTFNTRTSTLMSMLRDSIGRRL